MTTLLRCGLTLVIAALFTASGFGQQSCNNNCGAFSGSGCLGCHYETGAPLGIMDPYTNTQACADCPPREGGDDLLSVVRLPLPGMRKAGAMDIMAAVLRQGPQPGYKLRLQLTPERHLDLMVRALKTHQDGPQLGIAMGKCASAIRVGTREKLPGAIVLARERLEMARAGVTDLTALLFGPGRRLD